MLGQSLSWRQWAVLGVAGAGTAVALYSTLNSMRRKTGGKRARPAKPLDNVKVTGIFIYPIKRCGPIQVPEAVCTPSGLKYGNVKDRHWIVAAPGGGLLRSPKMATVKVQLVDDMLCVTAPGMPQLKFPVETDASGPIIMVVAKGDKSIPSYDCGENPAQWFTKFLEKEARLYASPEGLPKLKAKEEKINRKSGQKEDSRVAFASGYPYHLVTEESVADFNARLSDKADIIQFRPNIIVSGPQPYEEDDWREIWCGSTEFYNETACTRCPVMTFHVNPEDGPNTKEPLELLKRYRIKPEVNAKKPVFGIKLTVETEGKISLGDDIYTLTA